MNTPAPCNWGERLSHGRNLTELPTCVGVSRALKMSNVKDALSPTYEAEYLALPMMLNTPRNKAGMSDVKTFYIRLTYQMLFLRTVD